jgi:hypothetical protein
MSPLLQILLQDLPNLPIVSQICAKHVCLSYSTLEITILKLGDTCTVEQINFKENLSTKVIRRKTEKNSSIARKIR